MKKIISILLITILCVGTLSGCTQDELTATRFAQDLLSTDYGSFSGNISENGTLMAKFHGELNLSNPEDVFVDITVNPINMNNVTEEEQKIIIENNKLYSSTQLPLHDLSKDVPDIQTEQIKFQEFLNTYENLTRDIDYLYKDTQINTHSAFLNIMTETLGQDLREYCVTTLLNYQMIDKVMRIKDGFSYKMTGNDFLEFTDKIFTLIKNDPYGIAEYFAHLRDKESGYQYSKTNDFEIISLTEEYLKATIGLKNIVEEIEPRLTEYIKQNLADTLFDIKIAKYHNTYHILANIENLKGKNYALDFIFNNATGISSTTTTTNSVIKSYDTVMNESNQKVSTVNPTIEVNVTWDKYIASWTTNPAVMKSTEYNGKEKVNTVQFTLIDDRIYLPMRAILECLGETVYWDENEKQAYVMREERNIPMTGVIINDRTYLKIRDFSDIGYEISYEESGNTKNVRIVKGI